MKQRRNYSNDVIVDKNGTVRVVVHNNELNQVRAMLANLRHDMQEAGSALTELSFGSDVTKEQVQTALYRYYELSGPGV